MTALTVGVLARSVGLARSTLLYYDRIGLLRPSQRSGARYRLYGSDARMRLEAICTYRGLGLGLAEIRALLDARGGRTAAILTARLDRLNQEIAELREQQRVIVALLKNRTLLERTRALDKRRWVKLLAAAGLDEQGMRRWHVEFEALAPEAHQDFLESLGIPRSEIGAIRRWSRSEATSRRRGAPHP
jgi:DNA-binding transcriptional MerR regulator